MRKVMLLAAMLAMVLAAAAPAFAQAVIEDDGDDGNTNVQYVDCSQVQAAAAAQGQYGDANAAADDESVAIANISQDLDITQNQVNACLGGIEDSNIAQGGENGGVIFDVDDDGVDDDGDGAVDEDEGSASASASAVADVDDDGDGAVDEGSASASASAVADDDVAELPETGGASLLALGAGALLVAGGLVARRIVR